MATASQIAWRRMQAQETARSSEDLLPLQRTTMAQLRHMPGAWPNGKPDFVERILVMALASDSLEWTKLLDRVRSWLVRTLMHQYKVRNAGVALSVANRCLGWYVENPVSSPSRVWTRTGIATLDLYRSGQELAPVYVKCAADLKRADKSLYECLLRNVTAFRHPAPMQVSEMIQSIAEQLHGLLEPGKEAATAKLIYQGVTKSTAPERDHTELKANPDLVARVEGIRVKDLSKTQQKRIRNIVTKALGDAGPVPDKTQWLDRAVEAARQECCEILCRLVLGSRSVPHTRYARSVQIVNALVGNKERS